MATYKAELHTAQSVIDYYNNVAEQTRSAAFRVFAGSRVDPAYLRFEYMEDNIDEGCRILADALKSIEQNPVNTNVYLLQVVTGAKGGGGSRGNKKQYTGSNITFQLNGVTGLGGFGGNMMQPYYGQNVPPDLLKRLDNLEQENKRLNDLLLLDSDDNDDQNDPDQDKGVLGMIGKMVNTPEIQGAIAGAIVDFISSLKKKQNNSTIMNQNNNEKNVSGYDSELIKAIDRLKIHVPDLSIYLNKLADIADNDKAQFNMLLGALKAS